MSKILQLASRGSFLANRLVSNNVLSIETTKNLAASFSFTPMRSFNYNSNDLWKSVLLVSTQGSKKGRGKGKRFKDLNTGQVLGDGKLQVLWPGLNTDITNRSDRKVQNISILGEDVDREKRLTELRNKMDKFRRISTPPHERGFTGSAIEGKSTGEPKSYDSVDFSGFDTRIIEYKAMISHKSILGKKKVCSCFVVTGNGKGVFGFGLGKGSNITGAMNLAKSRASQRLLLFEPAENRTVLHNFYQEYHFTKLYVEKVPKGYGLRCHRVIKKICQLIGIKDIFARCEASTNPRNVAMAFITGLLNQKKFVDIANEKKMHVVEFNPELNNYPTVLASPTTCEAIKQKKGQDSEQDKDLDLYLFGNKVRLENKKRSPFYSTFASYKHYCLLRDRDNEQKRLRIQRYKILPDDILRSNQYPKKHVPKVVDAETPAE